MQLASREITMALSLATLLSAIVWATKTADAHARAARDETVYLTCRPTSVPTM